VRTVAGVLEAALSRLFSETVKITGAGRTDSGVHATGQVVSLITACAMPVERMELALNSLLPADCSVREIRIVEDGFSARFSAIERTYVYAILNRTQRSALLERYAWHVARPLDLEAMQAAAQQVLGEHDFRSFCTPSAAGSADDPASTVRNVTRLWIERRERFVRVEVAANAFLHRMVRSLVGTLTEVGKGRRRAAEMGSILAAGDRSAAGPAAPARGLYLAGVRYARGYDSYDEPAVFCRRPTDA
jgi:tRNA pseudouridine38-40 synthase